MTSAKVNKSAQTVRHTWHQAGMSFKLISATLLFVALTTLTNGLYLITSERKILLEQMDAQGESLARAASIFAVEPLLIRDYPVLETFVENIIEGKHGIIQMRIIRADGKIAAEAHTSELDDTHPQSFRIYTSQIRVVPENTNDIGRVEINISTSRSDNLVSQRAWTLGTVSFTAFLALGLMISLLIRQTVSKPLHALAAKAKALGQGDLNTTITLPTRDELGVLADTLNSMRRDLKKSYSEIDQQNQELKELDRMKDEFLARISHEINTPLHGILGLCSALKNNAFEPLSAPLLEPINTIQLSANRLKTLANQLLSFRPPSEQRNSKTSNEIKFDRLLLALVDQHKSEMASKSLSFTCEVESGLRLRANAELLGGIFNNLLENAIKFTKNGRVQLTAESIENTGIAVSVIDTGIGIPEEIQSKIFDRFQQGSGYETRDYEGAGIGLALVKQDVELLGGKVILQSTPGKGSCFTVIFPLSEESSIAQLTTEWKQRRPHFLDSSPAVEPVPASILPIVSESTAGTTLKEHESQKKTILVVDDAQINRMVLNLHLQQNYNIIEAEGGKHCLARLEDSSIDLVLLDLMMPGISGFDILERMNNHPEKQYPRVIVVSALMDAKSISRALQLGAVDYLTKPYHHDELLARVRTHISLVDREFLLENQVHERTAQLEKANQLQSETFQQLVQSEKMSSLGLLSAGIAHEINNPIGYIQSNLGTLNKYSNTIQELLLIYGELERSTHTKNEKQISKTLKQLSLTRDKTNFEFIMRDIPGLLSDTIQGARRITAIVQSMKGFAHSQSDTMAMADINRGLEDSLSITRNELKNKCTVNKSLQNLPKTYCNLGQLNQVFANLLVNAAQAMDGNGDIEVSSELIDNVILVRIADTGHGIKEENIQHLFEPFFTTKPVGQGTGLGLYVSYEIIQQHNGSIDVRSELGKGTAFTIRLPVTEEGYTSSLRQTLS